MATNNALNNAMIAFLNDNTFASATTTSGASSSSIKAYVDAYFETGTWTPSYTFATPGDLAVSYSSRPASYTRIITPTRKIVFVVFSVSVSSFTFTTASGEFRIAGLPFAGAGSYLSGITITQTTDINWGTNATYACGIVGNGVSYISIRRKINNNSGNTAIDIAGFTSGFQPSVNMCGWYYTTA